MKRHASKIALGLGLILLIPLQIMLVPSTAFTAPPAAPRASLDVDLPEAPNPSDKNSDTADLRPTITRVYKQTMAEARGQYRSINALFSPMDAVEERSGIAAILSGTGMILGVALFDVLARGNSLGVRQPLNSFLLKTAINVDLLMMGGAYLFAGTLRAKHKSRNRDAAWRVAGKTESPAKPLDFVSFSPMVSMGNKSGGMKVSIRF